MSNRYWGYQVLWGTSPGWQKVYASDGPQALEDVAYQDRVFRWAVAVQEYSFRVEDIPGKENIGADFLSRTPRLFWLMLICSLV